MRGSILSRRRARTESEKQEQYFVASQGRLVWLKFKKHKLAIVGGSVLALLYFLAIFCEFFAVIDPYKRYTEYIYCPPQRVRFFEQGGRLHLRPFVYRLEQSVNIDTLQRIYTEDPSVIHPISLFVRGDPYRLWNLIPGDIHFLGVKEGVLFLFGTDKLGRDLFSRNLYAIRISLSIGLIGVAVSFTLGCLLGGISGFYGGTPDMLIQRIIEFLISIPVIPLWMGLAAALPPSWPTIRIYFAITIILGIISWPRLARVVRGKLISVREEDFVMAAKIAGASEGAIIGRHLLPSFSSYLIVSITLSVPRMILGETSLSFLGLGLQPPAISWGVLLQGAPEFADTIPQSVAAHTGSFCHSDRTLLQFSG